MPDSRKANIQVKFEAVRTKRFEVSEPETPIDHDDLQFLYTVEISRNDAGTQGIVNVDIDIIDTERPSDILAEITTTTVFAIRGLVQDGSDSSPTLPRELVMMLTSLSVSTTRGILVERTANTELGTIILPPFDPVSFFQANDATEAPSTSALT